MARQSQRPQPSQSENKDRRSFQAELVANVKISIPSCFLWLTDVSYLTLKTPEGVARQGRTGHLFDSLTQVLKRPAATWRELKTRGAEAAFYISSCCPPQEMSTHLPGCRSGLPTSRLFFHRVPNADILAPGVLAVISLKINKLFQALDLGDWSTRAHFNPLLKSNFSVRRSRTRLLNTQACGCVVKSNMLEKSHCIRACLKRVHNENQRLGGLQTHTRLGFETVAPQHCA